MHRNFRPRVLLQRAGQQAGLGEHLEAVADADDRAAGGGEVGDRVHHRREAGDGAGAQVVAVGEAAGDDDRVDVAPSRRRRARASSASPPSARDRLDDVELAVRAREQDDADAS